MVLTLKLWRSVCRSVPWSRKSTRPCRSNGPSFRFPSRSVCPWVNIQQLEPQFMPSSPNLIKLITQLNLTHIKLSKKFDHWWIFLAPVPLISVSGRPGVATGNFVPVVPTTAVFTLIFWASAVLSSSKKYICIYKVKKRINRYDFV